MVNIQGNGQLLTDPIPSHEHIGGNKRVIVRLNQLVSGLLIGCFDIGEQMSFFVLHNNTDCLANGHDIMPPR